MKIKRIEHIAVAVKNIQASIRQFKDLFDLDLEYEERAGDIHLAMIPVGDTYVELLQGVSHTSRTGQMVPECGEGVYHICFEIENINEALEELKLKGVSLIDENPRIGHGGSRVAFLDPKGIGNLLIELVELPKPEGPLLNPKGI